jgi:SNF2 family DNA or RNA helicase
MIELWDHQKKGIELGLIHDSYALLFEQGTGKTRTAIEILRRRFAQRGRVMNTLILGPVIVCENWRREIAQYSKIKPHDVVVLSGTQKKRVYDLVEAIGPSYAYNKIVITNYEATQMEELYATIAMWRPEIIICDESQRLKSHTSIRAKKVCLLADKAEHKYMLTGTPILNSPADCFMQWRIMDNGKTFGKNFHAFKNQYFEDRNAGFKSKSNYFPDWQPRAVMFPIMRKKIENTSLRVLKNECLDLPPLIKQEMMVELSAEQRVAYEQMKQEYITWIKSQDGSTNPIVAELAVTKALRLQQIVSGYGQRDDGQVHRFKNPRLDVLEELLEDLVPNHKVIVWACFKQNYVDIADRLNKMGIKFTQLHGEVSGKDRQDNIDMFRNDKSVRVLIANQQAAGLGINLIEASYAIYYSKSFSLEHQLQSEARNHRGGSEMHDKVTQIHLVAGGTIDETVNTALAKKDNLAKLLIDPKNV